MKKVIMILSALVILTQVLSTAAHAGRDGIERGRMGYGESYDCSRFIVSVKPKLTSEQDTQFRSLNEKYAQQIQLIREQLRNKGRGLKAEWLQTEPDLRRIEVFRREAAKLQERLHAKLVAYRVDVLKILTSEQRAHVPEDGQGRISCKSTGFGQR
jgi:Spy/CpxP family protein refolding chaperone